MKPPHSRGPGHPSGRPPGRPPGRPFGDRGPSGGPGFGSGQQSHGPARQGGGDRPDRPRPAEGRGAGDRFADRPDRAGAGRGGADRGGPGRGGPDRSGDRTGGPGRGHGAPRDRDRPAQTSERTGSDRPRSERPYADRPYSDRPYADRPYADRPRSDRPRSDRPASARPDAAADRPTAERPRQERLHAPRREDHDGTSDRRQQSRPYGDRSPGDRSHADRPGPDRRFRDDRPRPQARVEEPAYDTPRAPHTASGGVWLYGQHAVAAALANPSRRLRRLMLTEEAEAALAQQIPPPWALQPERVDRARIDQLLGHDAVHQGAALLADPLAPPSLAAVLERPGPVLVLDQVTDPRNVGAILRCAAAFGAAGVITQDRNAPEETGSLAKAASGALETVPLLRAVNIARTLVALKAANLWVVGLDAAGPAALSGASFAGRRVALVLGAEGSGLRRLTRETCDELAGLATSGAMAHLNVAAATAVALYELTRPA